jgi:hypothetical protein
VAATYRSLLRDPLFDVSNESTLIVESEIRDFVIERLKILLSMSQTPAKAQPAPAPVALPFSESEIRALKLLLDSMAKRGMIPKDPPAAVAKEPVPKPAPVAPAKAPQVRRALAPAPAITPTKAIPRPAPRAVGRPPTKAAAVQPAPEEDQYTMVTLPNGEIKRLKKQKGQIRPAGMVAMPTRENIAAINQSRAVGSLPAIAGVSSNVMQSVLKTVLNSD